MWHFRLCRLVFVLAWPWLLIAFATFQVLLDTTVVVQTAKEDTTKDSVWEHEVENKKLYRTRSLPFDNLLAKGWGANVQTQSRIYQDNHTPETHKLQLE